MYSENVKHIETLQKRIKVIENQQLRQLFIEVRRWVRTPKRGVEFGPNHPPQKPAECQISNNEYRISKCFDSGEGSFFTFY